MERDISQWKLLREGTRSEVRAVPDTDRTIRIFPNPNNPNLEFAKKERGLYELEERLRKADAPILERTRVIDLEQEEMFFDRQKYFHLGIIMPNVEGKIEPLSHSFLIQPKIKDDGDINWDIRPNMEEYIQLLGRLHANNIVISPSELNQSENQVLKVIPALVEGKFTLLDWTNLALIEHIDKFDENPDENRAFRLGRDITNCKRGFGYLIYNDLNKKRRRENLKIYLQSFLKASEDKEFVKRYEKDSIGYFFGE